MKSLTILFNFLLFSSLCCAQNSNWLLFDHNNAPFVSDSITWVETDTSNVKWVGTTNGLYSFYNNAWTTYNTSNSGLLNNRIDQFKIAYDNTIWFLNHNKGFIKLKNNVFTHYNKTNTPTMRTDSLVGLTIDSNEVYFWSRYDGIVRFNALTSTVFNIDTNNSYLKNIITLQYHNNHTLHGLCSYNPPVQFPQNRKDSMNVAVFTITTAPTFSINYCYEPINVSGAGCNCNYIYVQVDKYQNREEFYTINNNFSQGKKQRLYDKNNILISDISLIGPLYSNSIFETGGQYYLYRYIYTPAKIQTPYGLFDMSNSIIPDKQIIHFDSDKNKNIWIATSKGLVGYNHSGVITTVNEMAGNNGFSIFPNPANDVLQIRLQNESITPYQFKILNNLGQEVFKSTITSQNQSINIRDFSSGIYFIEATINNTVLRKKIIKE